MEHLIIHPSFGLCNRLRVIAAGLRFREFYGTKLSIVFPQGNLRRLVKLPDDVEVLMKIPGLDGFEQMKNTNEDHLVDYSGISKVYTKGGARFDDVGMPPFRLPMYAELIRPSDEVEERARSLEKELELSGRYVGMHIRRGDHFICKRLVPLSKIQEVARRLLEEDGMHIVMACEDTITSHHVRELSRDRVKTITQKESPWRGVFHIGTAISDFAELLLVSRGEYVVGSEYSSYSRMAIAYNGNSRSFLIGQCKKIDI